MTRMVNNWKRRLTKFGLFQRFSNPKMNHANDNLLEAREIQEGETSVSLPFGLAGGTRSAL